jgi:hypothetical protein
MIICLNGNNLKIFDNLNRYSYLIKNISFLEKKEENLWEFKKQISSIMKTKKKEYKRSL